MKTETVKISEVKSNPNNPRVIKDDNFKKLVNSIKEFPKMLKIRPIVVNDDMIVLGGNMRLKACKEAGLKEVPIIKAENLTEDEQRQFIIKDNVSGGEWDWDMLTSDWDTEKLEEWGLEVPNWSAGMDVNSMTDDDVDITEEFDPVGASKGHQRIVMIFENVEEAENWLSNNPELESQMVKRNMAWQINLTSQSI